MKYIYGVAIVTLLLVGGFVFFLYHGYPYTMPASSLSASQRRYVLTQKCIQHQAEGEAVEAPVKAQMEVLAEKLAYGPLPQQEGQETYDMYVKLRAQVNQLQIKYAC